MGKTAKTGSERERKKPQFTSENRLGEDLRKNAKMGFQTYESPALPLSYSGRKAMRADKSKPAQSQDKKTLLLTFICARRKQRGTFYIVFCFK